MAISIPKIMSTLVVTILGIVLALVIWQPVFPSGWIIQGLAKQIDPRNLSLDKPAVLRFELAGKGGGFYNLMLSREKVEVTEGDTHQVDLIIATNATDFNKLVFQMAQGKADEFAVTKLVISNVLKIAGDMSVLQSLNPTEKGKQ
jgi:hypothetical protein